jgi:hypothetical protein
MCTCNNVVVPYDCAITCYMWLWYRLPTIFAAVKMSPSTKGLLWPVVTFSSGPNTYVFVLLGLPQTQKHVYLERWRMSLPVANPSWTASHYSGFIWCKFIAHRADTAMHRICCMFQQLQYATFAMWLNCFSILKVHQRKASIKITQFKYVAFLW